LIELQLIETSVDWNFSR